MTISRPAGAAAALALPFAFVMAHLLLRIEPPLGAAIRNAEDIAPVVGTTIVLGALLLSLLGLTITAVPLIRDVRSGVGVATSRDKVAVALLIAALVVMFIGAIVIDQLPCWRGVPNCD